METWGAGNKQCTAVENSLDDKELESTSIERTKSLEQVAIDYV